MTITLSALLILQALFFSRPDDKGLLQGALVCMHALTFLVTSKIALQDILTVEGVNEAAVKTDNVVHSIFFSMTHSRPFLAEETSAFCSPHIPLEGRKEGEA